MGLQDIGELRGECKEKDPVICSWNNWISKETWRLIAALATSAKEGGIVSIDKLGPLLGGIR